MGTLNQSLIEWGVAGRALPGQKESGDHHLVKVRPTEALVAVVDGLGHGEGAAAAAKLAIAILKKGDGESPIALIQRCHEELRSTRGVVMSLAMFHSNDNTMTWLGVGNVEGFLLHRNAHVVLGQEALLLRSGVVGDHLPRLSASIIEVGPGDLLIFATDGIRPGFADNVNLQEAPQQTAHRILTQYGQETDDALVLVVRYLQGQEITKTR
jgi:serine/threonine protein phosphatase PrpC